ncbi:MAG: SMC-Scp complex subunit ScpB [Candidatus Omnitrophica bacterium]|nr:SMC-Scp complex subunit ScpB [Candidatus Omnitrophota bacterium]
MEREQIKSIIEAVLFVSDKPVSVGQLKEIVDSLDGPMMRQCVEQLQSEYEKSNRSFQIVEVAGGFQMTTGPEYGQWLKKLYKSRTSNKLSQPALETLAIVAYRQPIIRSEIELIRGVNVDGVLATLLERGVVKIAGRRDVIGRPLIYATTREFLEYFGLNSLKELPQLKEFKEEDIAREERLLALEEENDEKSDAAADHESETETNQDQPDLETEEDKEK